MKISLIILPILFLIATADIDRPSEKLEEEEAPLKYIEKWTEVGFSCDEEKCETTCLNEREVNWDCTRSWVVRWTCYCVPRGFPLK